PLSGFILANSGRYHSYTLCPWLTILDEEIMFASSGSLVTLLLINEIFPLMFQLKSGVEIISALISNSKPLLSISPRFLNTVPSRKVELMGKGTWNNMSVVVL